MTPRPLSDSSGRPASAPDARGHHAPWRGWWEAIKRAIVADDELSAELSRIDDELRAKGL